MAVCFNFFPGASEGILLAQYETPVASARICNPRNVQNLQSRQNLIGIKGDEVATYALCVALADVFDALISKRSYKHAWTPQEAYDEIVSQKGRQFAPFVVDAFIENFDKFVEITKKYPDEEKKTA